MPNATNINNGSVTLTTATTGATGTGIRVSVSSGIFYVKGHFVFTESQSIIVSKYSDSFTGDIGFRVVEDIVTTEDDNALFDNQGAAPNQAAPGADRYRITLTLVDKASVTGSENFVFLIGLKEGSVAKTVSQNDPYNIPSQVTAQRIKDNSGDYVVDPFVAQFDLDSQDTHLLLKVSDGVGVVDGFRVERNPSDLRVPRASSFFTEEGAVTAFSLGNYVKVSGADGNSAGLPNIDTMPQLGIYTNVATGGTRIGNCRVRAVNEDGANYRFYLFDINLQANKKFSDAKSIGSNSSDYFNIILEGNPAAAVLHETNNNTLLFPLNGTRPRLLSNVNITTQRRASKTITSGAFQLDTLTDANQTFANDGDWIIASPDSDIYRFSIPTPSTGGVGQQQYHVTLSPAPDDGTIEVLHYVKDTTADIRSKTLTQVDSEGVTISTDSSGRQILQLAYADVYDIQEVRDSQGSVSVDIRNRFDFDNGQRDNFYDLGKLILRSGSTAPAGNVKVKYRYFQHGAGSFFAVNSYDSAELGGYRNIPTYVSEKGDVFNLSDVIDFRPVKNTSNGFAVINNLPQPNTTITSNNQFFLEESGKLVLGKDGVMRYIKGDTDVTVRSFPIAPEGTMGLYDIVLGAKTFDDSDVLMTPIQNRRYTMKDIGTIEKRVERLEEAVTLSLLEVDTKNINVLDSSGANRTRSGFVADNFDDQLFTDFLNRDYSAAIDPFAGILHCAFKEDNIRLIFDNSASSNVVLKGDNVYLAHDSAVMLDASKASTSVIINPFDFAQYKGGITLSPSSDDFRDVNKIAGKTTNGGIQLDTKQAYLWNNHKWNWGGVPLSELTVGSRTDTVVNSTFNKVISDEKVRKIVAERVVDTVLIPFQRSLKVFFKALGLRPNTQHFAFYDRQLVTNNVREETFVRHATQSIEFGTKHKNATQHPEGKSDLVSDSNGTIEGSFFIPQDRFRTGTREFALIDVSEYTREFAKSQSRASTNFSSTGHLDTVKQDIVTTRVLTVASEKIPPARPVHHNDGDGGSTGTPYFDWTGNGEFDQRRSFSDHAKQMNARTGSGRSSGRSSSKNTQREQSNKSGREAYEGNQYGF